jgi:hypothetical protein
MQGTFRFPVPLHTSLCGLFFHFSANKSPLIFLFLPLISIQTQNKDPHYPKVSVHLKFLKKLKTELPTDPTIPLLGMLKGNEPPSLKAICTPKFSAALFTIFKI